MRLVLELVILHLLMHLWMCIADIDKSSDTYGIWMT